MSHRAEGTNRLLRVLYARRSSLSTSRRSKLSVQLDIENITDNIYLIAHEGEFSPAQVSIPRLISATAKLGF